jgi:4a-hydroxytetrahydrobiopterin dehydratase
MMADRTTLPEKEVAARLQSLKGWSIVAGKLHKEFRFSDFVAAFGFMASAALIAESMNHHPDWSNVYNRVVIDLVTHDAGGITERDMEFADRIERLVAK